MEKRYNKHVKDGSIKYPEASLKLESQCLYGLVEYYGKHPRVVEMIEFLKPDYFYYPYTRRSFEIISAMHYNNGIVSTELFVDMCTAGDFPEEDADAWIRAIQLGSYWAAPDQVVGYCLMTVEYYFRRQLKEHLGYGAACLPYEKDIFDFIELVSNEVRDITAFVTKLGGTNQTEIENAAFDFALLPATEKSKQGYSSGLTRYDNALGNGWQPGTLNIVAARPGAGKSALMMTAALHLTQAKIPVKVFSLEMTAQALVFRIMSSLSHIALNRLKNAELAAHERDAVAEARRNYSQSVRPYLTIEDGNVTMERINSSVRSATLRLAKPQVVFVDYLQLVKPSGKERSREEEIANVSKGLLALAKEYNIAVVALAQLNREVESRYNRKPKLSDLRESGQIEQDAHTVTMIYRPEMYKDEPIETFDDGTPTAGKAELMVLKNRDNEIGIARVDYNGKLTLFEDAVSWHEEPPITHYPKSLPPF